MAQKFWMLAAGFQGPDNRGAVTLTGALSENSHDMVAIAISDFLQQVGTGYRPIGTVVKELTRDYLVQVIAELDKQEREPGSAAILKLINTPSLPQTPAPADAPDPDAA